MTLVGKTCLLMGSGSSLDRAIAGRLRADGAAVITDVALTEASDASWKAALLDSAGALKGVNVVVTVAIPSQDGGFGRTTLNDFRWIMESSYTRTFLALKYGIQLLRTSGGGTFISVTSHGGAHGAEKSVARCAASNGIVLMTKSAALECANKSDNVRVNALLVGDILRSDDQKLSPGHVTPADVAASVAYLAGDAASYLTGLALPVDNGWAQR